MSTGLECDFIEAKPSQWYLVLERWDSPKGAFDWRDYADCFGPFPTEAATDKYLRDNFANPGGMGVWEYVEGRKPDETYQRLIDNAQRPQYGRRF